MPKAILRDNIMRALPGRFAIGEKVKVKADGRIGEVENFWQSKITGSIVPTSFKYLVVFPAGNKEYFHLRHLEKA